MINYSDFEKIDIRVGTVIEAKPNQKSDKPSLYLIIDFGEKIGKKKKHQRNLLKIIYQNN